MPELVHVLPGHVRHEPDADPHLREEWMVANGLGGYASGTVSGAITRRYHGLLIAALPNPLGRTVMLNGLTERLRLPGRDVVVYTGAHELTLAGPEITVPPSEFRLEAGLPVWRYEKNGFVIEKRLLMPYRQNTVHVTYRLLAGTGTLRLGLRPAIHFRSHDAPVGRPLTEKYVLTTVEDQYEIAGEGGLPPLRLFLHAASWAFTFDRRHTSPILYRTEHSRGYEAVGTLWTPGYFRVDLKEGDEATLVASTEEWEIIRALSPGQALRAETHRRELLLTCAPPAAREGPGAELVLAADQFVVTPVGRVEDTARAQAFGGEVRTVIAGYHWFTDWGRDTMIGFEGLTLATGRHTEGRWILRTFADYVRDGLIPNLFPEGRKEGLYHTADATLWFFHAIHRYLEATGDRETLRLLLPRLADIVEHHLRGTRFGIGVDPADGLLRQGEKGYQLTWMDAKVGDWVVTPRRGKTVEINALWYNALRLLEGWLQNEGDAAAAARLGEAASRARESFNRRFWYPEGGYLYDVVDGEDGGDDPACRPNQLLAVSLAYPVLEPSRWEAVVETARERLLTPVGLRSLAPGHPDYKDKYYGDLRSRDAAYHQGTVWAWLIGPFVDAWLKVHPGEEARAREFLRGFVAQMDAACIGSISEIFDAEQPYTPRGCIAQAWSVAEVLRCWVKTAG